eukprot:m.142708 g.142708  ORF g.142708 m.142708 type:complete len:325 (+) comp38368_c0_seq3:2567-3541(+)
MCWKGVLWVGRAYFGMKDYKRATKWFDKAVDVLPEREYKHTLYQAHKSLAKAKELQDDSFSDVDAFRVSVLQCQKIADSLKKIHGATHRFVGFAWREIASLSLHVAKRLSTNEDQTKVEWLSSALEFAFDSLVCHESVFGHKHQKVAKSSHVVADVCIALIEVVYSPAVVCAKYALEKAISNFELIECAQFPAVKNVIEKLKDKLKSEEIKSHDFQLGFKDYHRRQSTSGDSLGPVTYQRKLREPLSSKSVTLDSPETAKCQDGTVRLNEVTEPVVREQLIFEEQAVSGNCDYRKPVPNDKAKTLELLDKIIVFEKNIVNTVAH